MGYSVAIRARSKKMKGILLDFMERNYRQPSELFNQEHNYSKLTDDLSYDHGKNAVGFDYNACEPERDYIFAVCRWMAIKAGRTMKNGMILISHFMSMTVRIRYPFMSILYLDLNQVSLSIV